MKDSNHKKPRRGPYKKASKGGETQAVIEVNDKFAHVEAVQARPLEVKVYNSFDKALKAFRALVQKERILSSYKEKQSYEKPSDKRRRKRNEMKRKRQEMESSNERSHSGGKKNFKSRSKSRSAE